MKEYKKPNFDFKVPNEFVTRKCESERENPPYRSEFMRDRDRVMYCGSFRRLAGKTQIYLAGTDDNRRNRLTHTLEVSQIARTIAGALNLDCDLTEAIALGHDMGHTPFGHAGEQILHEIMVPDSTINIKGSPMLRDTGLNHSSEIQKNIFGFKHNIQSLRVAASIERGYGQYGLNLTNYTLWGMLGHSSREYKRGRVQTEWLRPNYQDEYASYIGIKDEPSCEAWSFEAYVVAQSDEIAQWHHDLEDAIRGNAMSTQDICKTIEENLKDIMNEGDAKTLNELKNKRSWDRNFMASLSRIVVNSLVNRIIECTDYNLNYIKEKYKITKESLPDLFNGKMGIEQDVIRRVVGFDFIDNGKEFSEGLKERYSKTISEKIHHSMDVERMNAKGQYIIKKLAQAYFHHPQQLPDGIIAQYMVDIKEYSSYEDARKRGLGEIRMKFETIYQDSDISFSRQIALLRKICDHISGMTDHYAIEEYKKLYE